MYVNLYLNNALSISLSKNTLNINAALKCQFQISDYDNRFKESSDRINSNMIRLDGENFIFEGQKISQFYFTFSYGIYYIQYFWCPSTFAIYNIQQSLQGTKNTNIFRTVSVDIRYLKILLLPRCRKGLVSLFYLFSNEYFTIKKFQNVLNVNLRS